MIKKDACKHKRANMQEKTEIDQKDGKNSTYINGETNQSKLKSSPRGSIIWFQLFNQTTREIKLLKRSQIIIEKLTLER